MDDTVASDEEPDKAAEPWGRDKIRAEIQSLYSTATESSVRLKCLELLLDMTGKDAPKDDDNPSETMRDLAARVRAKIHGSENNGAVT